ncbi:hypothetical protein CROQUDRAFT_718877 [Cronartium quercuum f. sp. fusiforme G11]|uniref:RING-type domain-containing protein n=1 Tax=Cronartium quercuum f. sp. fusiforme G11 TaxID=708437 RepID=A0A9P6T5X1_9BASI|nr:hypothetical protein CROQUDRAFT_718877 [Cronartium quercuum f. sp. fusiforme G11]
MTEGDALDNTDPQPEPPSLDFDERKWTTYDYEDGGYDYVTETNENLMCPICRNPFIDPVMCESTDHIFCRLCLVRSLEQSPTCPIDRLPLSISVVQPAPKLVQRLVDELLVDCPFKNSFECSFRSQRYLIKTHTDSHACERAFRMRDKPSANDSLAVTGELRFKWSDGRARRLLPPSSGFPSEPCSSPASSETACRFAKFGCTFLGTHASLQHSHLPSPDCKTTKAAAEEEGLRCFFAPVAEILDSFLELETENKNLRTRLADGEARERAQMQTIECAHSKLIEANLERVSVVRSESDDEQLELDHSPPLNSYNMITNHLNNKFENQSELSSNQTSAELLWNRIGCLEDELARAQESGWVLKELVRTLTRQIGLLSRQQLQRSSSDSSSSTSSSKKGQMKL